MSVIDPIPHHLSFLEAQPGFEDENGDWHEGYEDWSKPIKCHAVENGSASTITYADGTTSSYSYIVGRLPKDIKEFQIGERVRLEIFGQESEYTVKDFQRKQYQSKLWL